MYCFLSGAKCAAAVLRVKEISDEDETENNKSCSYRGHSFSFWTQALTVMCGRVKHYSNYVLLHNQCVYRDGADEFLSKLVLNVHQCCKYFCLSFNDWKHNKVNPISAEHLTSACVNTFYVFRRSLSACFFVHRKKPSFCREIKAADPVWLRFDAHCGYFNHLSPNMTSHCTSVLYRCVQSLQACFTLRSSLVVKAPLGLAQHKPLSNWWGSGTWRDSMCFIMIKQWARSPSVTRHQLAHTSRCC